MKLEKAKETLQNQMKDSDMIFTQLTTADFNYDEVKEMLVKIYVPNMTISRAGIAHAMKRLEKHFSCWLCRGIDPVPETEIIVEAETPGGKSCDPKTVKVHYGCYMDIEP